jgi:ABC-type lipoprotein export system ATPase subunit
MAATSLAFKSNRQARLRRDRIGFVFQSFNFFRG